jgi:hypothetical protein
MNDRGDVLVLATDGRRRTANTIMTQLPNPMERPEPTRKP